MIFMICDAFLGHLKFYVLLDRLFWTSNLLNCFTVIDITCDKHVTCGFMFTQIELKTAPADFRFPTTNQTRHCFTRYIEYHR